MPNGGAARVTFDRNLCFRAHDGGYRLTNGARRFSPRLEGVVIELKFTDRYAPWTEQLVQSFELQRCSMPKYVTCIQSMHSPAYTMMRDHVDFV